MAQQDRINGLIGTLGIKAPVRVATTANITLSGEQTIDGVAVVAGDRVLVKDQTTGSENGIYAVATTAWAREPDFDGSRDVVKGTQVLVSEGTVSAGLYYRVTSSDPIVVGTSSIAFAVAAMTSAGGTMTGDITMSGASIIEAEGAAVASAATCDIWTTDGGTKHITGTAGISSLGTAPQAGMWMKIVFDDALILTHGANLNLPGAANITTAAGDFAFVYADTTTQLDVLYFRKDGTAVVGSGFSAASQAEMEAAASNAVAATPGRTGYHPGVAKAWAYVTVSGGTPTLQTGHNIASITDTAQGKLTITMTTAFSTANWSALGLAAATDGSTQGVHESGSTAKTSSAVLLVNVAMGSGVATDPVAWNFAGFGDQ